MIARRILARATQALRQANYWLVAQLALFVIRLLRLVPVDTALNFVDRLARRIGPLTARHRIALDNLRQAYPEKSPEEISAIALDMWGNMAKLAAEYIFLDALYDFDPVTRRPGRVEVVGEAHFDHIAAEDAPHIIFTAHLGNFELLPIAAAEHGMKLTAMFRPPNNPYIADYIQKTRGPRMGGLLPSRRGVSFALARILEERGTIGVLVDQKFMNGLATTFFGRPCETSPLVAKLARQFKCNVYPARCIRLPGNRFRLEIEDRLELPRDSSGRLDAHATTQLLNDTVERWVREHPGQWMWFHNRWHLTHGRRSRPQVARTD